MEARNDIFKVFDTPSGQVLFEKIYETDDEDLPFVIQVKAKFESGEVNVEGKLSFSFETQEGMDDGWLTIDDSFDPEGLITSLQELLSGEEF